MAGNSFSRFEDYIQRLIEGGFAQLFAGRLHPREVATALAEAMENGAEIATSGKKVAPDVYIVRLNAQDHAAVLAVHPDLDGELANEIIAMARAADFALGAVPKVRLIPDDTVNTFSVAVTARHSEESRTATSTLNEPDIPPIQRSPIMPDAYLQLKGQRLVPLESSLVNIGRHRDNHIIIDDPSVSRHHAQIRFRFGQFVIFDTGSSGGTTVNGHRINEAVLKPGDLISLAGYTLRYIEEDPTP